jgi:hypothetical protein
LKFLALFKKIENILNLIISTIWILSTLPLNNIPMDSLISSFRNIRLLPTLVVIRHSHKRTPDELSECELGQTKIYRIEQANQQVELHPVEPMHVDEEHIREPPTLHHMSCEDDADTGFLPFPRGMSCDHAPTACHVSGTQNVPHYSRPEHVIIDMSGIAY